MNRRDFVTGTATTVAVGSIGLLALPQQEAKGRLGLGPDPIGPLGSKPSYHSKTISIQLAEEQAGITSVYLTEHGDANYVVVEAFYWTNWGDQAVMLHKEATTMLAKDVAVGTELDIGVNRIVFLRVKEMKLLNQSEFGKTPGQSSG